MKKIKQRKISHPFSQNLFGYDEEKAKLEIVGNCASCKKEVGAKNFGHLTKKLEVYCNQC